LEDKKLLLNQTQGTCLEDKEFLLGQT